MNKESCAENSAGMEDKMITQRPKGTQDWYGDAMHKRTVIEKMAREL